MGCSSMILVLLAAVLGVGAGVVQEARDWWAKATQHEADQLYLQANEIYQGRGMPGDAVMVGEMLRRSADLGHGGAMHDLGYMLEEGELPAAEFGSFVGWYEMAADRGVVDSMINLGNLYHFGHRVEKSEELEYAWYLRAAEAGSSQGMLNLGVMHATGRGVGQSFDEALAWYRRAAEIGDMYAMYNIGCMYLEGEAVAKDEAMSNEWFRRSAREGYLPAKEWLEEQGLEW